MIESIKNQADAYELRAQFAAWLCEERCLDCDPDDIAVTADTIKNFYDACREIESVAEVEAFSADFTGLEGGKVAEFEGTQRVKGEPRRDLYILDTGSYRLVYAS